jgi:hypothetical protein
MTARIGGERFKSRCTTSHISLDKAFAIKRQSIDSYTGTSGSVMAGDIATEAIRLGWQHPFALPVLA